MKTGSWAELLKNRFQLFFSEYRPVPGINALPVRMNPIPT
jgi:hypothetical protein